MTLSRAHEATPLSSPATLAFTPGTQPAIATAKAHPDPKLDATRSSALLLRDVAQTAETALNDTSAGRRAGLVIATSKLTALVREVSAIDQLHHITWKDAIGELAWAVGASRRLEVTARAEGFDGTVADLDSELAALGRRIDASKDPDASAVLHKTGVADKMARKAPLTADDQVELAHQTLAAARESIGAFHAAKPENDRDKAIQLCAPIPGHLNIAADAAMTVGDRQLRMQLTADVEAVSTDLDGLSQALTMTPKLKWDPMFARMFDSENLLRKTLGLGAKPRPYTGRMDPDQAADLVKQAATAKPGAGATDSVPSFDTPGTAIQAIIAQSNFVFDREVDAVSYAGSDLAEPAPPKDPSVFDTILGLVLNMTLAGAAGAIGAMVADRMKRALDGAARSSSDAVAKELTQLTEAERAAIAATHFNEGAITRAMSVDAAKDAAKQVFKDSMTVALQQRKPNPTNAGHPLHAFLQAQHDVLVSAKQASSLKLIALTTALSQLDLASLNELVKFLASIPDEAFAAQYDHTMVGWQNLKTRLEAEAIGPPNAGTGDRPLELGSHRVSGLLDVRLDVDPLTQARHTELTALHLTNGEPAAVRYFKSHPRSLATAGLYQLYHFRFGDASTEIIVGVGADGSIQPPSSSDMKLLKMYASSPFVTKAGAIAAVGGAYDDVSDAVALRIARELIGQAANVSTAKLEE